MTTNPGETGESVPATQADRVQASRLLVEQWTKKHGQFHSWMTASTAPILLGHEDDCEEVQAFARHRLAHTGPRGPEVSREAVALYRDIAAEAEFLCARIDDLDWCEDMEELARQHAGHVDPSHYRLKHLIEKLSLLTPATRTGEVERLREAAEAWADILRGMKRFGMESTAIETVGEYFADALASAEKAGD